MKSKRRNKGRQKFLPLQTPNPHLVDPTTREDWINNTCQGFVSNSKANKSYYRVVLEVLWPEGHGIPGPYIVQNQLREAIDNFRRKGWPEDKVYKNYVDVFRRIRELQGEEGVKGIAREGHTYQLVDIEVGNKRTPRIKLNEQEWEYVLKRFDYKCAVCHRGEPEVKFDQDHKIPRDRGGTNELDNWQPLCGECNNFKSTSCRGCKLDCNTCSWAFPRKFAPLKLESSNILAIRDFASKQNIDPNAFLNNIVSKFIKENLE